MRCWQGTNKARTSGQPCKSEGSAGCCLRRLTLCRSIFRGRHCAEPSTTPTSLTACRSGSCPASTTHLVNWQRWEVVQQAAQRIRVGRGQHLCCGTQEEDGNQRDGEGVTVEGWQALAQPEGPDLCVPVLASTSGEQGGSGAVEIGGPLCDGQSACKARDGVAHYWMNGRNCTPVLVARICPSFK